MRKTRLDAICTLNYGKAARDYTIKPDEFNNYRVFGTNGPIGYTNNQLFTTPSIIIGRKGAYRGVHFASEPGWVIDTAYYLVIDDPNVYLKWLYYRLLLVDMNRLDTGAAIPSTKREDFYALKIGIPNSKTQNKIASILSVYDDLIENNRRRLELLEKSASLIYKEWFVHLRFPGYEHTKIIDGVPEGWTKVKVKEVIETVRKPKKIKKSDYQDNGEIPCIDQGQEFIGGYIDDIEAAISIKELPVVVFGDHSRTLKYIDFPFASGADGTQILKVKGDVFSTEFLYYSLISIDLSNYFYARHFKFLKEEKILIPSDILIELFEVHVKNVLKQINMLRSYNMSLSGARDLLLPRLMNGEIKV